MNSERALMSHPAKTTVKLFLLACLAMLAACAPVAAWERGNLARPEMAMESDPLEGALDDHIYFSKEASSGGNGAAGGGCGCN